MRALLALVLATLCAGCCSPGSSACWRRGACAAQCQARTPRGNATAPSTRPPPPQRAQARQHGSGPVAVFRYLASTYDADGDGRIVASEYTRDAATFARLDRDGNDALTQEDFTGPLRMDEVLAQLFLMRHLGPMGNGGSPAPPTPEDVQAAFARIDVDASGRLSAREVTRELARPQAKGPVPDLPQGVHAYAALLRVWDGDRSGDISLEEVRTYLGARATAAAPRPAAARAAKGPAVGQPAPDFILPLRDGSAQAQLSDYRGVKPVALIFGSWT